MKALATGSQELDEEQLKKVNKYNKAVENKDKLDKILYQAFINLSEHIQFQMNTLNRALKELDASNFTAEEFKSLTESFYNFFARDAALLRSIIFFSITFCSYDVEIMWLDEIAEGLKHATQAINSALL